MNWPDDIPTTTAITTLSDYNFEYDVMDSATHRPAAATQYNIQPSGTTRSGGHNNDHNNNNFEQAGEKSIQFNIITTYIKPGDLYIIVLSRRRWI